MKKVLLALTTLIAVGTLWLYGMNPGEQAAEDMITITQGGNTITIPRDIAKEFTPFKDLLEDMGEVTGQEEVIIPLPEYAATLDAIETIAAIIERIQNNPWLTRPDGIYIARRIKPFIDHRLAQKSIQDINHVIRASIYLEVPYITNGAIRV